MTSTASRAKNNKPLEIGARVGFAVNGVLHILIGGIALGIAFGGGGEADQGGALGELASNPVGAVVLWLIVVGLAALGLFSLLTAVVDKDDKLKNAGKGIAYLAVAATALTFALGGSSDSSETTKSISAKLLETPGGVILLVILGLAVVAIGVYFIVKGARKKFLDDVARAGRATSVTGTIGYIAKGVAVVVVGILFIVAAFTTDASKASGLDGALKSLADLPLGVLVLAIVAIGLIAFGLYSFARARYAKL